MKHFVGVTKKASWRFLSTKYWKIGIRIICHTSMCIFYSINLILKRHWLFKIEKLRNPDRVFKDMLTFSFTWTSENAIGHRRRRTWSLSFDKALSFLKLVPKMVAKEAVEIILKLCTHFLDPPLHDMQTIHFIIFFRAVFIFRIQHYLGEDTSLLL